MEFLPVIRKRCAGRSEGAGEREGAAAQLHGHGSPIGEPLQLLEGDGATDGDIDIAAEAVGGFPEQEGNAQRIAEVAGKLEASRILAGEIDRHHRGAAGPRQLGGEGVPRRIHRLAAERGLAGGDTAGREDRDGAAMAQEPLGLDARGQGIGLGLLGAAEIDGQHMRLELGRLAQEAVGEDARLGPSALGDPAQGNAVEDAEGMVGDEQHRPGAGNFRGIAAEPDLDAHQANRGIEERLGAVLAPPGIVKDLEARLAAQLLDGLDDGAPEPAVLGAGIGEYDTVVFVRDRRPQLLDRCFGHRGHAPELTHPIVVCRLCHKPVTERQAIKHKEFFICRLRPAAASAIGPERPPIDPCPETKADAP